MAHIAHTAPTGFAPVALVRGLIADAQDYMARRKEYNRVMQELMSLNDRELNDVGLSRSDFHAIAVETAAQL
ncbi:DUF1127 domain-containing protein [Pelagimonas varians]|uniref:YjiS-like domain-containing protein n=1 Tax=Pelagimonas varians TaxID=696760 RepID=A0A238K786_9RHOB|nr:DUF1127 domain-containing protein [Pelagimonas varians]PYG30324.1 uncharacterized protein DUF1127 [Pelagimonas varians]SMX37962.1 hypothetical protein PEV8663_01259 [Pelagimonas varians]